MKYRNKDNWVSKLPDPGVFFLDSGAHSIYNLFVRYKNNGYAYYDTDEFWEYVDAYAQWVKGNLSWLDHYANVDAIFNAEISWRVQKYLEDKHGLNPVPVIHYGTDYKWVHKHVEEGYEFIGIGGLGQEATAGLYRKWADGVYEILCDNKERLPVVKTHGFAMTSYSLIIRYPWYSVDSSSWAKNAAFGSIYVPHLRRGEFTFLETPYVVTFSDRAPNGKVRKGSQGRHYNHLPLQDQGVVRKWLDRIEIPLGSETKEGVINHYGTRAIANMRFYEMLCQEIPQWPWAFKPKQVIKGFK